MEYLTKNDLAQINRSYLQSLDKEIVIDVACKLREFSIALVERLEQNSSNSSRPPPSDNPYDKGNTVDSESKDDDAKGKCSPSLAQLKKACNLGSEEDHLKLRALAREILNDWDAVVAFVKNPKLPPTNNDAEQALRHAVISRRISFGTRTTEGSMAYASLLSVIET